MHDLCLFRDLDVKEHFLDVHCYEKAKFKYLIFIQDRGSQPGSD